MFVTNAIVPGATESNWVRRDPRSQIHGQGYQGTDARFYGTQNVQSFDSRTDQTHFNNQGFNFGGGQRWSSTSGNNGVLAFQENLGTRDNFTAFTNSNNVIVWYDAVKDVKNVNIRHVDQYASRTSTRQPVLVNMNLRDAQNIDPATVTNSTVGTTNFGENGVGMIVITVQRPGGGYLDHERYRMTPEQFRKDRQAHLDAGGTPETYMPSLAYRVQPGRSNDLFVVPPDATVTRAPVTQNPTMPRNLTGEMPVTPERQPLPGGYTEVGSGRMNGEAVRIARDDNGRWQVFNNAGERLQANGEITDATMQYRTANNQIARVNGTLAATYTVAATGGYTPPLGGGSYNLVPRAGTTVTVGRS
jgi:hypothetical protein